MAPKGPKYPNPSRSQPMSNLFLTLLAGLIVFAQFMNYRTGGAAGKLGGKTPVLYWAVNPSPEANETVKIFRAWLGRHGYPDIDLRFDVGIDQQKVVVQAVTGVGSDFFNAGSSLIPYYKDVGICADLTGVVEKMGLSGKDFYGPTLGDMKFGDRFYAFPNLTSLRLFLVNRGKFKALGLVPPSGRLDFKTFEALGVDYVTRANKGLSRRAFFFADSLPREIMMRSVGISYFNETLTGPDFTPDDKRFVAILELVRKWTELDHLAPTESELSGFNTEGGSLAARGGYGAEQELFYRGNFALLNASRGSMILIRQQGAPIELGALEPPHGGFPNTIAISVAMCAYTKSPGASYFKYFLEFLRSEDYNLQLIRNCNDLPPNPVYQRHPELVHPSAHPNEWPLHEGIAAISESITYGRVHSPWIIFRNIQTMEKKPITLFMFGKLPAVEVVAQVHQYMTREIAAYLKRHPESRGAYTKALERQKMIDGLKAAGQPVPLSLIDNTFAKAYLAKMGRAK